MLRGEAALRADQGPHQVRARPRHAAAHHQGLRRGRHRPLAAAAAGWSGSTSCSSTGGTMPCRAGSRRPATGWTSCSAPARSTRSAATNFDTAHMLAHGRQRRAAGLHAGAVFAARPPPGQRRWCAAAAEHGVSLLCYGTVAGGFLATAGWACPSRRRRFENRSLIKYKLVIDDFGGWALFQALLATLRAHRRPPRQRHRHRGERRDAARGRASRPSSSARATARISPRTSRSRTSRSTPRITPRSRRCWPRRSELDGDVYALERDRNGRHGSIMKYNLNKGAA